MCPWFLVMLLFQGTSIRWTKSLAVLLVAQLLWWKSCGIHQFDKVGATSSASSSSSSSTRSTSTTTSTRGVSRRILWSIPSTTTSKASNIHWSSSTTKGTRNIPASRSQPASSCWSKILGPAVVHASTKQIVPSLTKSKTKNSNKNKWALPSPGDVQSSLIDASSTITTRVGELAAAFEMVLKGQQEHDEEQKQHGRRREGIKSTAGGGEEEGNSIPIPVLLNACRNLESMYRHMGQTASAADLRSNIKKVEDLYQRVPPKQHQQQQQQQEHHATTAAAAHNNGDDDHHHHISNTPWDRDDMMSLLRYEKDVLQVHHGQPENRLRDPSGAMGLLWIRRSIAFNYRMYYLVLHGQKNPGDAAMKAYEEILEPYHGWTFQRVYVMTIRAVTPSHDILWSRLGGFHQSHLSSSSNNHNNNQDKSNTNEQPLNPEQTLIVQRDLQRLLTTWKPLISRMKQIFQELKLDDTRRV